MKTIIKNLKPTSEFFFVVFLSFGYPIYASMMWLRAFDGHMTINLTNGSVFKIILFELCVLIALTWILKLRESEFRLFNFEISWKLTAAGVLLYCIMPGIDYISFLIFSTLFGGTEIFTHVSFDHSISLPFAIAMSTINPIFEESIVVGYVTTVLEKRHDVLFVIGVSTLIRFAYHLYQGPVATISIIPIGIIFALVYWHWRKLWPLIIAHCLMDFLPVVW